MRPDTLYKIRVIIDIHLMACIRCVVIKSKEI
jgi:hypothetical protein